MTEASNTAASLVQVGWMMSPDLAAEFGITPTSDEYLITLEQAEQDGGIKDEYVDRVIPIYRVVDEPYTESEIEAGKDAWDEANR